MKELDMVQISKIDGLFKRARLRAGKHNDLVIIDGNRFDGDETNWGEVISRVLSRLNSDMGMPGKKGGIIKELESIKELLDEAKNKLKVLKQENLDTYGGIEWFSTSTLFRANEFDRLNVGKPRQVKEPIDEIDMIIKGICGQISTLKEAERCVSGRHSVVYRELIRYWRAATSDYSETPDGLMVQMMSEATSTGDKDADQGAISRYLKRNSDYSSWTKK